MSGRLMQDFTGTYSQFFDFVVKKILLVICGVTASGIGVLPPYTGISSTVSPFLILSGEMFVVLYQFSPN
jgi:hypothetical protein